MSPAFSQMGFPVSDPSNEVSPIVMTAFFTLPVLTPRPLWTAIRPHALELEASIPSDYHSIGFATPIAAPRFWMKNFCRYSRWLPRGPRLEERAERWSSKVLDYKVGYSMTWPRWPTGGNIVVGVSGGEAGIRGFVMLTTPRPASRHGASGRFPVRRTGARELVRRCLEDGGRRHLGHWSLRSRIKARCTGVLAILAGLEWRRSPRR